MYIALFEVKIVRESERPYTEMSCKLFVLFLFGLLALAVAFPVEKTQEPLDDESEDRADTTKEEAFDEPESSEEVANEQGKYLRSSV